MKREEPETNRHESDRYDWREHQCTWRDCIAESLLLVALFVCFFLVTILS